MALALFDLDNTLLAGDSDYLWGQFLASKGLVDSEEYAQKNQEFYEDYKAGKLDIHAFLRFSLAPLTRHSMDTLANLHNQFMTTTIQPLIRDSAQNLVDQHRRKGDTLVIITATNRFVTEPIARAFGIENLLATEPEIRNGRYTGEVTGTPCFQEGKIERLNQWLAQTGLHGEESWFYSDSRNDLPLLEQVDHPAAVDPDPVLQEHAELRGWPIISLHTKVES